MRLTSQVFRNSRAIRVYVPRGYYDSANAGHRYPVLYLNDGFAVFSPRGWNAPARLDSLICAGTIEPIIMVGIDNAASIPGAATPLLDRMAEYLPYTDPVHVPDLRTPLGDRYPLFLTQEVLPLVEGAFRVRTDAAGRVVGGSSYGGIAALVAVLRAPGMFGGLLLESTPLFVSAGRLVAEAAAATTWPDAVYVGQGSRETDDRAVQSAADSARSAFASAVAGRFPRSRLRLNEVWGASHTSAAVGARLPQALAFFFSPLGRN